MGKANKPVILISSDAKELDGYTFHATMDWYVRSVALGANGTPLIVPALADQTDFDELMTLADGILLTGSRSNVSPALYGRQPTQRHEPFDIARDGTALPLILRALDQGVPLFAICRGHQELNVALGGSLDGEVQDLPGRMDHRGGPTDDPIDQRFKLSHDVSLSPFGMLSPILGASKVKVNSVHRQAIGTLGGDLNVEAHADDGTIEAISVRGATSFALGVQWHPEYWVNQSLDADEPSTKLFQAFGDAVNVYRAERPN
ncbi:MAG: gamma-glutamyl-gamma-aminobutyrate hydrolase family protein [Pseudomonadota bacterium]